MKVSRQVFVALIAAALAVTQTRQTVAAVGLVLNEPGEVFVGSDETDRYGVAGPSDGAGVAEATDQIRNPYAIDDFRVTTDADEAPAPVPVSPALPPVAAQFETDKPASPQITTGVETRPEEKEQACLCHGRGCGLCAGTSCGCRPNWTFQADGMVLFRSAADSRALVQSFAGQELLNTSELDSNFKPGMRFALARRLCDHWDVELAYMQADDFRATDTTLHSGWMYFSAPNFLALSQGPAAGMNFTYTSRLYSTELNFKRHVGPAVALLGGFRWIELSEEFSGNFVQQSGTTPFWITDVNNHLYGLQLGTEVKLWDRGGPLSVLGTGKAGVYYNDADQTGESPYTSNAAAANEVCTSFVGELDITASYRLSRHVALRAGYEVLWLTSVALAPEQVDATNFAGSLAAVNAGGDAVYHGFLGGVEVIW
jgi:hypothetical protein